MCVSVVQSQASLVAVCGVVAADAMVKALCEKQHDLAKETRMKLRRLAMQKEQQATSKVGLPIGTEPSESLQVWFIAPVSPVFFCWQSTCGASTPNLFCL